MCQGAGHSGFHSQLTFHLQIKMHTGIIRSKTLTKRTRANSRSRFRSAPGYYMWCRFWHSRDVAWTITNTTRNRS